jgi:hypothetical protein
MAYSRAVAIGNGSGTQFAVNFALDYLEESDVKCRVGTETDGSGNPLYRNLTFLSTNLIQVGGAPAGNGVLVVFERTVDKAALRIDYNNGDQLDEDNLMTSQKQLMMAVHEVLDGRFATLTKDIDLGSFRAINLGDPINAQDAATKTYVDAVESHTLADRAATAADRVQTGLDVNSCNTAVANAAALFDLFDDRWLGSKTSNPTVDNDGNALLVGALYWNSNANELRVYSGSVWVAYSPTVGLTKVQDDTTPKLGGDLDLNGHVITGLNKTHVGLGNVDNTSDANKPVSTAQTTALAAKSDITRQVNSQTGTSYQFVMADAGKLVTFTNAAAVTAFIPLNSTTAFPINTQIDLASFGAGKVTISAAGGVTITSFASYKALAGQYAGGTLVKTGTDTWWLVGNLIP